MNTTALLTIDDRALHTVTGGKQDPLDWAYSQLSLPVGKDDRILGLMTYCNSSDKHDARIACTALSQHYGNMAKAAKK